jgi:YVTN family beta-propeller protein
MALAASAVLIGSLAFSGTASAVSARNVYGTAAGGSGLYYWPSVTNTPVTGITVTGGGPVSIAVTTNGAKGYLPLNTGSVTPFNTSTNTVGTSFFASSGLTDVAISPDGTKAYVGNGSFNTIKVIDTATDAVSTIPVDVTPDRLALSPDGTKLYMVNRGVTPNVTIRSASSGAQIGDAISLGDFNTFPEAVAVTPDGNKLYIASTTSTGAGKVSVVDLTATPSPTVSTVSGITGNPAGIAATPDGSEVWTANNGGNSATVIRTSDDTIVGSPIDLSADGLNPNDIAITPDGKHVYVSNSNAGSAGAPLTFSYIDTATKTKGTPVQIGTFPGPSPNGVAIVPDQPPVADFNVTPGHAGASTDFDASASTDPDGTVASYHWDFGDSTSATTSTPTTSHTYAANGNYDAILTVTDNEGCSTDLIYTGHTASCNGSGVAQKTVPVVVAGPPPPPTVTGTTPASGANNNHPKIIGTAEAGSTVKLFTDAACTQPSGGVATDTNTAVAFLSPGLAVTLADNSTTTFYAAATNGNGTSPCSTTFVTYSEVTPPPSGSGGGSTTPPPATPVTPKKCKKAKKGSASVAKKKCKKKKR